MKILALFGRESNYPHNELLVNILVSRYEVDYPQPWVSTRSIILRSLQVSLKAIPLLLFRRYQVVLVGFYGYLIMLVLRRIIHSPVIFDAFVSNYDTLVNDRQMFRCGSLAARAVHWLDRTACQSADLVLVDTQAQKEYFVTQFGLDVKNVGVVYAGCSDDIFAPEMTAQDTQNLILHYGTATPQHGLDTILQAAGMLSHRPDINFMLVGPAEALSSAATRTGQAKNTNIRFTRPVPFDALPGLIRSASVCLCGHFGGSEKASRVIAAKTYQCIAMGKAVIVGDNSANREILTPGVDAFFCPVEDPAVLAHQIEYLVDHPEIRASLGNNAAKTYHIKASSRVLTKVVLDLVEKLAI